MHLKMELASMLNIMDEGVLPLETIAGVVFVGY